VSPPIRIWRLSDGRRGHDNQSLGLIEALARIAAVETVEVAVRSGPSGALRALAPAAPASRPALVVGAGHATHPALLLAARRHRARSVVLMKPSLPLALFDLCIVPVHDGVSARDNVITSLGALNRVRPAPEREPGAGLVLLGGPSRHHHWDEQAVLAQVHEIAGAQPAMRFEAAGSPRTPASTLAALAGLPNLRVVAFADTAPGWLPARLARAAQVWVTPDSVSMAYEAVSSGAATGILALPARSRARRLRAALEALRQADLALTIADWRAGRAPRPPARPLQEAQRCARALLDRWPDLAA